MVFAVVTAAIDAVAVAYFSTLLFWIKTAFEKHSQTVFTSRSLSSCVIF